MTHAVLLSNASSGMTAPCAAVTTSRCRLVRPVGGSFPSCLPPRRLCRRGPKACLQRAPLARSVASPAGDGASDSIEEGPWQRLGAQVGDELIRPRLPLADLAGGGAKATDPGAARRVFELLHNPYAIGDGPGLTQTFGWVGAWVSRSSVRAVAARHPDDIAVVVNFARRHRLRLSSRAAATATKVGPTGRPRC